MVVGCLEGGWIENTCDVKVEGEKSWKKVLVRKGMVGSDEGLTKIKDM